MFTFESWIYPHGIAETDELYVMPYINGGVGECYIIKKDAPDVLYKGWWNLASYGGGSDEKDVFIINSVYTARTATRARTFCPLLPLTAHGHCPEKCDILDMARNA